MWDGGLEASAYIRTNCIFAIWANPFGLYRMTIKLFMHYDVNKSTLQYCSVAGKVNLPCHSSSRRRSDLGREDVKQKRNLNLEIRMPFFSFTFLWKAIIHNDCS